MTAAGKCECVGDEHADHCPESRSALSETIAYADTLRAQLDAAKAKVARADADGWNRCLAELGDPPNAEALIATLTRERDEAREALDCHTEGAKIVNDLARRAEARAQAVEERAAKAEGERDAIRTDIRRRTEGVICGVAVGTWPWSHPCYERPPCPHHGLAVLDYLCGLPAELERTIDSRDTAQAEAKALREAKAKAEEDAREADSAHAGTSRQLEYTKRDLASATTRAQRAEEEAGRLREQVAALRAYRFRTEGIDPPPAALASPQGCDCGGTPPCANGCYDNAPLILAPPTEPGKPEDGRSAQGSAPNPLPCAAHGEGTVFGRALTGERARANTPAAPTTQGNQEEG